jgi:uncharacterized protein GlcG (DUF336 family)
MFDDVVSGFRLAEQAILKMLNAAVLEARKRESPVGVTIVDTSGLLRAYVLMDGAPPIAQEIATKKARTAAFIGAPTGGLDSELAARLAAAATDFTDLHGGLPIAADGAVIGGIAASGGSAAADVAIAQAGLVALTL